MALIHCDFFSEVLRLCTSIYVVLPEPKRSAKDGRVIEKPRGMYPTLYLLHGLSDDHTIWQRRTSIERYAANYELAVVMPAVHRSFYADMTTGYRYFTYVTGELPSLVRSLFPLSEARKDNFVAGLSMGGYGAFKIAMTLPDQYAAAASLSGALDVVEGASYRDKEWQTELKAIFGKPRQLAGSANDLFHLAEELAVSKWKRMPLFQWCGTEDILITQNWRFRDHAKKLGLNLYYGEGSGEHEWGVWDQQIQRVLEWLPLKKTS